MQIRDLWYKNAVIYALDVEAFQDSNGDGIGDLQGLSRRLAYLAGLGVTCLWLHPFYPSPRRDHGYDVADYYGVDPRFGNLGDFVEFAHQAEAFGMRIIVDLVINHTSDQHPWFQAARSDPKSPYRDFYVWSKEKPENITDGIVFPGYQESVWSYDKVAKEWYYHRFYDFQPDLNFTNPAVRQELQKIMGFWLEMGVSGFRVDAVPFLIEMGAPGKGAETHDYKYLEEFRQFLAWRSRDAIVIGEANVELHQLMDYFGEGDRMQMLLNFFVNQHLFNSIAQQNATPLMRTMESLPDLPQTSQWGNFLRNHDEIDLGRLTGSERQHAYEVFGPDPDMQLYDRGLRRRLAPMLGNDAARLKLAYSLMFSLPGTPVLRYGDEIGMGDDLTLPERNAVRTPMQWSDDPNAGFSNASPEKLVRPVISDGEYGYPNVNVEAQQRDANSILNAIVRLIRLRKEHPEFGLGEWTVIDTGMPSIFALRVTGSTGTTVAVHNLAEKPCIVPMRLKDVTGDRLVDLLFGNAVKADRSGTYTIELEAFGFRWLRVPDAYDLVTSSRSQRRL